MLTLISQHSPLANLFYVYASFKTSPKNPLAKKGRRKEYITCITYATPTASLNTLHEKTQWEKLIKEKKSTTVDVRVGLQSQLVISRTTIMDYAFGDGLPLNPATV